MTRRSIDLVSKTDPDWVNVILDNFDEFLIDHAACERKASALAMSLVVRYPDRDKIIPRLIDVAQEELLHFAQVYELMGQRGLQLAKDEPDPYVNHMVKLMRHGRDERLLDRLLISSVIECRGAERFGIIAEALEDPKLKAFYKELWAAELKHGHVFVEMALKYITPEVVYRRLQEFAVQEADIIKKLPWRPSLH
ncbi:MAG: tRNA-(ms[2]io[6]A)-hydroxylase [Pseudomonadota bacterium]